MIRVGTNCEPHKDAVTKFINGGFKTLLARLKEMLEVLSCMNGWPGRPSHSPITIKPYFLRP